MRDEVMVMVIQRTPLAAQALADRAACSPRERQLLILCNGTQSTQDITALLGQQVLPLLQSLESKGLLTGINQPHPVLPPRSRHLSMVAGKVYVLDLLELQQNEVTAKIARALQIAREPSDMVQLMLTALDAIRQRSGDSYAERAVQRVCEVIPDTDLEHFIHSALAFNIPLFSRIIEQYRAYLPVAIPERP